MMMGRMNGRVSQNSKIKSKKCEKDDHENRVHIRLPKSRSLLIGIPSERKINTAICVFQLRNDGVQRFSVVIDQPTTHSK